MFHTKGHMKEVEIAGGLLTLAATFNPLDLNPEERGLVFSLVDRIADFEKRRGKDRSDQRETDALRHSRSEVS